MTRTITVLVAIAFLLAIVPITAQVDAAVFMKYDGVDGEAKGPDGKNDWFVADSFSFGVEREMKESGEKGGTADINIGVGELQEITITKSMDLSTAKLAQFAINGNSLGACEICLTEGVNPDGTPKCYLHYKLDRCYVKSWSTATEGDDRPTEEVAFYYNKIAFAYTGTDADGDFREESMTWDVERNRTWLDGLRGIFDIFQILR